MFLDNPQLAMSDSVRAKARARQAKRRAILKVKLPGKVPSGRHS